MFHFPYSIDIFKSSSSLNTEQKHNFDYFSFPSYQVGNI